MNDPNGLVYYNERYHLFFQHNPEANVWGNMSWGHASSLDLVNWTEHPLAIPHEEGEAIYSGSAVVDHGNSSGFGGGGHPPLVAIYTSVYPDGRQAQSLAFSVDAGLTWTKYSGNPVVDRASTAFRDPKVSWYPAGDGGGYWVMVAVEAKARQVVFYRSDDLRNWSHLSTFGPIGRTGGLWECPDLFALPVDGDPDRVAWVLLVSLDPGRETQGSWTAYVVGDFDGVTFTADAREFQRLDWGRDFYAATSFDNVPGGRRIVMGWMSNWNYAAGVPTSPWRGTMSLPRELSLVSAYGEVVIAQRPVVELRQLDDLPGYLSLAPFDLEGSRSVEGAWQYRLDLEARPINAEEFGLDLLVGGDQVTRLGYSVVTGRLSLDRTRSGQTGFEASFASVESAPVGLRDGMLRLQVFVDSGSVEVFAQEGLVCLTDQVFATDDAVSVAICSFGGMTRVMAFEWMPLQLADIRAV